MKKNIFNNLYKDVTYFFILCSLTITLIVWILQAVNFLDIVSEDGHSLFTYFKFSILSIPKILSKLMLLTYFLSLFYILGIYEDKNQLLIFWLNGIKKNLFLKAIMKFSIYFLFFYFFLSFLIVPYTQDKARSYIRSSNLDFFPSLIKPKKFIDTVSNLTIFLDEKNENSLKNVLIKDASKPEQTQIIISKGGAISDLDNFKVLKLKNGIIINYRNQQKLTSFNFEETNFNLKDFKTKTTTAPKIQEISSRTLLVCLINLSIFNTEELVIKNLNCEKSILKKVIQEIYKRTFMPVYIPLLSIIVVFLVLKSKNNSDFNKFKSKIFILGILIIILSQISVNLINTNLINILVTLSLPLIMIIFFYNLFLKKMRLSS